MLYIVHVRREVLSTSLAHFSSFFFSLLFLFFRWQHEPGLDRLTSSNLHTSRFSDSRQPRPCKGPSRPRQAASLVNRLGLDEACTTYIQCMNAHVTCDMRHATCDMRMHTSRTSLHTCIMHAPRLWPLDATLASQMRFMPDANGGRLEAWPGPAPARPRPEAGLCQGRSAPGRGAQSFSCAH